MPVVCFICIVCMYVCIGDAHFNCQIKLTFLADVILIFFIIIVVAVVVIFSFIVDIYSSLLIVLKTLSFLIDTFRARENKNEGERKTH